MGPPLAERGGLEGSQEGLNRGPAAGKPERAGKPPVSRMHAQGDATTTLRMLSISSACYSPRTSTISPRCAMW